MRGQDYSHYFDDADCIGGKYLNQNTFRRILSEILGFWSTAMKIFQFLRTLYPLIDTGD